MKMLLTTVILFAIALCCADLFAQHKKPIVLSGKVVQDSTYTPLGGVHIARNGKPIAVADAQGAFSLQVSPGDTITWSHVGFAQKRLRIPHTTKTVVYKLIRLEEVAEVLAPVEVRPWPADTRQLKAEILRKTPQTSPQQNHALRNMAIANYHAVYGGKHQLAPMSADDNYRNRIEGPQGFDIGGAANLLIRAAKGEHAPGTYQHFKHYMKRKQ